MVFLALKKLAKEKVLTICMVVASVCAGALLAAVPVYTQGLLQRVLIEELESFYRFNGFYPGTYVVRQDFPQYLVDASGRADFQTYRQRLKDELIPEIGLPVAVQTERLIASYLKVYREPASDDGSYALLEAMRGLSEHVEVIAGRLPASKTANDVVEVMVTTETYTELGLELDRVYYLRDTRSLLETPIGVRITGVFAANNVADRFWYRSPREFDISLFMDYALFEELFVQELQLLTGAEWYVGFEYRAIHIADVPRLTRVLRDHASTFEALGIRTYEIKMLPLLERYLAEERSIERLFLLLETPVLLLLFFSIVVVSRFLVNHDRTEIAVLKSRGAATRQVYGVYAISGGILALGALIAGPPLAVAICSALGAVDGFMTFVSRAPLNVRLTTQTYMYALGGGLFFFAAMSVPVLKAAGSTIVLHKQRTARRTTMLRWSQLGVEAVLAGFTAYGYYTYATRPASAGVAGGAGTVDPVLFALSTVFVFTAGLLFLRFFPVVIRAVLSAGRKLWSAAAFAAVVRTSRIVGSGRGGGDGDAGQSAGLAMLFLILAVSTGTFSSMSARTISWNLEEKIRYAAGAEIVIREDWAAYWGLDPTAELPDFLDPPPFERFTEMDSVERATRVYRRMDVNASSGTGRRSMVYLQGIVPHEFARIAYFSYRETGVHPVDLCNVLSKHPGGAVLSSSLGRALGVDVGDVVSLSWDRDLPVNVTVVGFVDYWPTFDPNGAPLGADIGQARSYQDFIDASFVGMTGGGPASGAGAGARSAAVRRPESYLVVANRAHLEMQRRSGYYEVWLRMADGMQSIDLYDDLSEQSIVLREIINARQDLLDMAYHPVVQGTYGMLTLGFLSTIAVSALALLIYSLLSVQERALQLALFRAMGLTRFGVMRMLSYEQILMSGGALLAGAVIGEVSAVLFIPFLELLYGGSVQIPPFRVVALSVDYVRLYAAVGAALTLAFAVLVRLSNRIRVFEALKLGEE